MSLLVEKAAQAAEQRAVARLEGAMEGLGV
jgi:hypothetical protein